MKRCPRCNRTYTDEQQAYCSIDGTLLEDERFRSPSSAAPYSPPMDRLMTPPPPYSWKSNPNMAEQLRPMPAPPNFPLRVMPPTPNKDMAVTALIMGALSLACFPIPFGQIALAFGLMALRKENKDPAHYGGKPFAITGIVIGGFTTLIVLVIVLFMLLGAFL